MKRSLLLLSACLAATLSAFAAEPAPRPLDNLAIEGALEAENATFSLSFTLPQNGAVSLPLVEGEVAFLSAKLPSGASIRLEDGILVLKAPRRSRWFRSLAGDSIRLTFASRVAPQADGWNETTFRLPSSLIRSIAVTADKPETDVEFPGGRDMTRRTEPDGHLSVSAFLPPSPSVVVRWKPQLRKREGELVASCEANVIAATTVGALRLDTLLVYRVSQGALQKMDIRGPAAINVTEVTGAEIQEWKMAPAAAADGSRLLSVTLRRPWESAYRLQITGDMPLPDMPCRFDLPALLPLGVMRTSGFLMAGADTAVKLVLLKTSGLTQIDQAAFPTLALDAPSAARALPQRNAFAWQYANLPYTLSCEAQDIVPEFSSDDRLVLSVEDRDLVLTASTEIEFRDAPAREDVLEIDPAWAVASVAGSQVADYDVRDAGGVRQIRLAFKSALVGRTLVELRLERNLASGVDTFTLPRFRLAGAKGQRGYVVASAEKGLRLKAGRLEGLREAHAGAIPVRVPDAQLAYRYRDANWAAEFSVERTKPALYAEIFNLCSIGEGVLYGSASISYHISGAPARTLRLRIPARLQNVEFTGRNIRNWTQEGEIWTVTLQEKAMGAYTLLVTFDQRMDYAAADFEAGGLSALDTEGEVGYLVIASDANLTVTEKTLAPGLLRIDREEIPTSYALLLNNPVVASYKYVGAAPGAAFAFTRHDTERLLDQVVDHTALTTTLARDGEAVTTVTYFIKNASQQYLAVKLPPGARLWSVRSGTRENNLKAVSPLNGEQATLIPLDRLRDPNTPLMVELSYAAATAPFGPLGGPVRLEAPATAATQSTFARWTVRAPARWQLRAIGGTLLPDQPRDAALWQVLRNVGRLWGFPVLDVPFIGTLALGLLGGLALILFAAARGRGLGLGIGLALLLVTLSAAAGGLLMHLAKAPFSWGIRELSCSAGEPLVSASRTLSLEGGQPLAVVLDAAPAWLGAGFSRLGLLASLGLGLLLAVLALARGSRPAGYAAAALLAAAAAGFTAGRVLLTLLLAAAPPLLLAVLVLKAAWKAGRRRRPSDDLVAESPGMPADSGFATLRGFLLALGVSVLLLPALRAAERAAIPTPPAPSPADLILQEVSLTLRAPPMNRHSEPSLQVEAVYRVKAEEPGSFLAAGADAVLTNAPTLTSDLKIERTPRGLVLKVLKKGAYEIHLGYVLPALVEGAAADAWGVRLYHPLSRLSKAVLHIPAAPVDVYLTSGTARRDIRETATETVVELRPTAEPVADIRWKPRARKTQLEQTVFFAEVQTYAGFEPGVVELSCLALLQIAQGQLQSVVMDIPAGMSVTAVTAPGLSTWRYDSDTRQLEALFESPVSGNLSLAIALQVPREGLPYAAVLAAPAVHGAARQRGAFALAVPDSVQIAVGKAEGVSGMAIEDFPRAAQPPAKAGAAARTLKRAYRYQQTGSSLAVTADKVVPEIRSVETATLSIGDERILLSSQLDVTVARAGIFSLTLGIPAGYDVETLTGQEVSHWDDLKDATNRGVVVHFQRQVLDTRRLNVVISRMEKGIEKTILLPRLEVRDAVKHSGSLVVTGERGVRLSTASRDGVVEINPRDLGVADGKALAYSLLRPAWSVTLSAEVLAPTLKPEVLHSVDLAEGMMRETATFRYTIENAGCKIFRIQAPRPGLPLTITGRGVAKMFEADPEKGIWQVELASKAEQTVILRASCQSPFDPANRQVAVRSFRALDAENQRGYVTVTSSGRMQVKPQGEPEGLKPEDSRGLPAEFGAGDLSDAILCYRSVSPDYVLALDVRRHGSAAVLPATVRQVELTSVLAEEGQLLTRARLELDAGDLRYLTVTLPGEKDSLWSVFVNGKVGRPSRRGKAYRLPLEGALAGDATTVEITYGSVAPSGNSLEAPSFDLPLNNVTWTLYLRPGRTYFGFGGDFTLAEQLEGPVLFDQSIYSSQNRMLLSTDLSKARSVMAKGESYIKTGNQKEAKQALEVAMNYSQGEAELNEDARVQYQNLVRQQAIVGLVQRRSELQQERQIDVDVAQQGAANQPAGYNAGNFTPEYAKQIEQALSADESANLTVAADKIIGQQKAATAVARSIRITVPEQGVRIRLQRPLVIQPDAALRVTFRSLPASPWHKAGNLLLVLGVLAISGIVAKTLSSRA
jgi:hypothetical protein